MYLYIFCDFPIKQILLQDMEFKKILCVYDLHRMQWQYSYEMLVSA